MRITFLNPTGVIGGAERCLLDLIERLSQLHPAWELMLVTGSSGGLVDRVRKLGVPCKVLPFPVRLLRLGDAKGNLHSPIALARLAAALPSTAGYALRLRMLLRSHRPDVIHTNGLKMHALGALTKPPQAKLLWHVHDYASARPLMARLLRNLATRCELVVANSKSVAADFSTVSRSKVPVTTILNGVDLDRFTPAGPRLDLDAIAGVDTFPGVVRVGLVATMAPWKGHEVFLRALALLPEDSSVRGYVIGGPIYETDTPQTSLTHLRDLATVLGIEKKVVFTGFIEDAASVMRSLDVVVHASTSPEPFGLVIIEAMACGKPVVVSKAGGAAEIMNGKEFALGNLPGDVRGMASNIATLATDPQKRSELGAASRRIAELRFDNRAYAAAFANAYQTLLRAN